MIIVFGGALVIFNLLFCTLLIITLNLIDLKYHINWQIITQYIIIYNAITIILSQLNPLQYIIKVFNLYHPISYFHSKHVVYAGNKTLIIGNTIIIDRLIVDILNQHQLRLYLDDIVQFTTLNQVYSLIFYQSLPFILIIKIVELLHQLISYILIPFNYLLPSKLLNLIIGFPNNIIRTTYTLIKYNIYLVYGLIISKYKLNHYKKLNKQQIDAYYKMYNTLNMIYHKKPNKIINQFMLNSLSKIKNTANTNI